MEMRNKLSEQRSGLGGELSSKLHVGPELDVLCDAVHKWDELYDQNQGGLREPIRPSLLNGAERLRQRLKALLGTDLTQPDPLNHCWHTGPVDYDAGDQQSKKPHKYMWAVAAGMAAGKGAPGHPRRKAQRYEAYVEKHLRDHMFKNGA